MNQAPAASAPFPIGSVQGVAARAWELCARDPLGLVVVPFVIYFPVYVFLVLLGELLLYVDQLASDGGAVLAAVVGVFPLVLFARVFGEAWIQVRTDAEAHGHAIGWGETFSRAFGRSWALVLVMLVVYALLQIGFALLVFPGILVFVLTSFANQSAVLGPGRLVDSLKESRDLVEHHPRAWFGMVAWWAIVFLGLGMLIGILRESILPQIQGGDAGFVVTLLLGMPLWICLIVFTACWTLFYRELQARRAQWLAAHPPAPHPPLSPTPSGPAVSKPE